MVEESLLLSLEAKELHLALKHRDPVEVGVLAGEENLTFARYGFLKVSDVNVGISEAS